MADYVPNNRSFSTLQGFDELQKQLMDLAQGMRADIVARQTLAKAAERAMFPVLQSATAAAPFDPKNTDGIHLKYTIRLDARVPTDRDKMSDYVNDTDAAIAVVSAKKSSVSLSQEFGNARTPAHPFLRPALDVNAEQVVGILGEELRRFIPEYAAKLGRMRKK
jgi:HK97 gp10 family phage protein